ncbi:MAG: SAM-dependent DNA methyltransferase [Methylococcales bacterium]|nr:SAM-dependent DNA methyltransferase [Methylococcales bacterium]
MCVFRFVLITISPIINLYFELNCSLSIGLNIGFHYTYHNCRNPEGDYEDVKGFCNAASIERVKELDYVLTPGRYVGLMEEADDFDFNERFTQLKSEFEQQLKEEPVLNERIMENLAKVKISG